MITCCCGSEWKGDCVTESNESGIPQSTDILSDGQTANVKPFASRELAQLRQIARSLVCVHPENDRLIKMLHSDGYIEYCPHCMRITDIYEPS